MVTAIEWLMEGDPAIRWQVMRDLTDAPPDAVATERARVAREGWGAELLALQADDGNWDGGVYTPKWTSTTYTLLVLRHLGIDPRAGETRRAVAKVGEKVTMGRGRHPYFAYRGETCVTAMVLALAAYFGEDEAGDEVVDWLLGEQLGDGGWNCETEHGATVSSFHTTISALEGLLEYQRVRGGGVAEVTTARERAHEYLLQRRMFRSLTTGEVVNTRWLLFSFPPRWHYDVLRGLDYLRDAGTEWDPRAEEAIRIVEQRRRGDGLWPLQNRHPGKEHFPMDPGPRRPSRWNTMRALRVLRWYRGDTPV